MEVLILAKEPVPGRVKTRLCPPCSAEEAATIAAAALADTLEAAKASGAGRVVAVLDGAPGPWLPPGVAVRPQGGGTFNERLERAWSGAAGPTLQLGMDTPQLSAADIADACATVLDIGAALGPALDGGWWALGLRRRRAGMFDGVEPSTARTGTDQLARLRALGIDPALLAVRRDVDTWADAVAVADVAPGTRFADAMAVVAASVMQGPAVDATSGASASR